MHTNTTNISGYYPQHLQYTQQSMTIKTTTITTQQSKIGVPDLLVNTIPFIFDHHVTNDHTQNYIISKHQSQTRILNISRQLP